MGGSTQQDPIGLAGGLNLYGFASGDPVNFGDPFGLCPEHRRDALGNCPGGLSVAEWRQVQGALQHMSFEGQRAVSRLLASGNIAGYYGPIDETGRVTPDRPGTVQINRNVLSVESGNATTKSWFDADPAALAYTLLEEARHVQQLDGVAAGEAAANFIRANFQRNETDAKAYAAANLRK